MFKYGYIIYLKFEKEEIWFCYFKHILLYSFYQKNYKSDYLLILYNVNTFDKKTRKIWESTDIFS